MGKRREKIETTRSSQTLPSSPSHSFSSSSDFEFTVSISPRKSSAALCPADELFYKGQLLPLQLSPRISMVRTLLLSSSSTSSLSESNTTASRDSTGSTSSTSSFASDLALLNEYGITDSCRTSNATDEFEFKKISVKKSSILSRFSFVFKKDTTTTTNYIDSINSKNHNNQDVTGSGKRSMSVAAKEVIRKYLKKVKPLYEKLSQKHQQKLSKTVERSTKDSKTESINIRAMTQSFSGNLKYPTRRSYVSSCPSSMRSSPSHSGVLCRNAFIASSSSITRHQSYGDASSMEELQSAIQGAIAHCKNSMSRNKNSIMSNEI